MRRILLLPVLLSAALALGVAGCAQVQKTVDVLSTPITNPVKPTNVYQVKLGFNLAVKSANKWADYCWSKTYAAITADAIGKYICVDRRQTRRMLSTAADTASDKIKKADAFVKANPTLVPFDLIDDAWAAVSDYTNLLKPLTP